MNADALAFFQKLAAYGGLIGGYLNFDAIMSDETAQFVTNPEPDEGETVGVTARVGRGDADAVAICYAGDGTAPCRLAASDALFDYYRADVTVNGAVSYYFRVTKDGRDYFYNKRGVFRDADQAYNFRLIAGYRTPDWAKGAVMYQIYVDRFRNGDPSNDVVNDEYAYLGHAARKMAWTDPVETSDVANFYGGDLAGVMEKLDYIASLGAEAIYLNPVFVSPSNHKYDAQDYDHIDPHIGVIAADGGRTLQRDRFLNRYATMYVKRATDPANLEASNALMARLIGAAHSRGIKVILDGVFNHCGAFNKWLDREGFYQAAGYPAGAYHDGNSAYRDYFRWYERDWPNNDAYEGWWGHDNHPKLNYENSPELYEYIMRVAKKWVSPPFSADGWRLDVAADLGQSRQFNHKFWRDFRAAVKSANPDAIILAEHYGDAEEWLRGGEWDTVMNYDAFMEPVTWFLTGMEKHSDQYRADMFRNYQAFESAMRYHMARLSPQALATAMNELSNHDHSRFLTRTNHVAGRLSTAGAIAAETGVNKAVLMEAVTIQMTWPGAPTVYYGDEAGLCGFTDPDNRRPYPWGAEDRRLIDFHRAAISLRRSLRCLRTGSLAFLGGEYGCFSYGRFAGDERVVVVINNLDVEKTITVPAWRIGALGPMRTLLASGQTGFTIGGKEYKNAGGMVRAHMPGCSSLVLREGTDA
ncbi:MAG: glycoside hydrolase family 13 protein [Clostridiales bacterium]|jgi:alpha-glucosidase|nr:glycoside hydrolase family 13 protein [Clostridiales bacterium]